MYIELIIIIELLLRLANLIIFKSLKCYKWFALKLH